MAQKLTNLPLGSLIKFGKHQVNTETPQDIIWLVADKNHSGYPANSVTLVAAKIIDLRAFDSMDMSEGTSSKDVNYFYSNINQWLNSNASAGNWWVSQYSDDTAPTSSTTREGTEYADRTGFLYNFTSVEQNMLLPTTITVEVGGTYSLTPKVFLPSTWEMTGTGATVDGSTQFSYFKSNSAACSLTDQAYNNTTSDTKPSTLTSNWGYHTRSAFATYINGISSNGNHSSWGATDGSMGIRPVINLANNIKITDTTDGDGCYTILPQTTPVISGVDSDLGIKKNYFSETNGFPDIVGFTQPYIVEDADTNDVITVKEYIDNEVIRSYVAKSGEENTFDVTGKTWAKLSNGSHTLKILATDGIDEVTRTYTFIKSVDLLAVQLSSPIASSTRPTNIIVTVVKNIPYDAKLKVEVCNNGFDDKEKVAWETIEDSGTSVFKHTFNNLGCYSGQWGVNIRVTVDRNGSEGACYITEIGGNFE